MIKVGVDDHHTCIVTTYSKDSWRAKQETLLGIKNLLNQARYKVKPTGVHLRHDSVRNESVLTTSTKHVCMYQRPKSFLFLLAILIHSLYPVD